MTTYCYISVYTVNKNDQIYCSETQYLVSCIKSARQQWLFDQSYGSFDKLSIMLKNITHAAPDYLSKMGAESRIDFTLHLLSILCIGYIITWQGVATSDLKNKYCM